MKPVKTFLSESNKIEDVFDKQSLEDALEAWDFLIAQEVLNEKNILLTHATLMKHHLIGPELGNWRRANVMVGGNIKLSYLQVPMAMSQWIQAANDLLNTVMSDRTQFLENMIKRMHVEFEEIHPFIDGNGRMGRILMNWQRDKMGLPILVILSAERGDYYRWFHHYDV